MAHVQIPAKEDVAQFPFHHAGAPQKQSFSLTGEGCEVCKVSDNEFVVKVNSDTDKTLEAITDFGPIWEAIQNLETLLADVSESHAFALTSLERGDKIKNGGIAQLKAALGILEQESIEQAANLSSARATMRYAVAASGLAFVFSMIAVGVSLWT